MKASPQESLPESGREPGMPGHLERHIPVVYEAQGLEENHMKRVEGLGP